MDARRHASIAVLVVLASLVAPRAGAAVDLTGKWRFSGAAPTELVDVVQTGSTVTFTYLGAAFTVTLSPTNSYTGSAPPGPYPCPIFLEGRVLPSGKTFDGRLTAGSAPDCGYPPFIGGLMATRCTCSDGNTTDGDGCSASCQVEPCFTCTGEPSVCSPSSDGATCDDGHDCTTGETCTAGTCAGGAPVVPCVDMTGLWSLHSYLPGFDISEDTTATIAQRGGDLFFGGGAPDFVGSINPASGAFDVRRVPDDLFCSFEGFTGTVAPDGNSLSGTGTVTASTMHCVQFATEVTGHRGVCGNGMLEGSEGCDDGNQTPGDGCDASCQVEVQTVLGKFFVVKDPAPGVDPSRRSVRALGKELLSDDTVVGDPITNGATIEIVANGATPSAQAFTLPAGAASNGSGWWRALGSPVRGYSYKDPFGANGPVKAALIEKDANGTFIVKVAIEGALGPITVVPPAPGTDGGMRFTIHGGARYCVAFGGAAGGAVRNSPDGPTPNKVFEIESTAAAPTSEAGCPTAP